MLKSFASLKLKFSLEGGYVMDYKISEKEAFTVVGAAKVFSYENAQSAIPAFWSEQHPEGKKPLVCGEYGISIDETLGSNEFEYLIADDYHPAQEVPEGLETRIIPKHTWAVFPCKGGMPDTLQETNRRIFSEWLPNCKEYEIAAGYNIEMYEDPANYPAGVKDKNYYSEIWIPVKKKQG